MITALLAGATAVAAMEAADAGAAAVVTGRMV
jgi:hypothetical protein